MDSSQIVRNTSGRASSPQRCNHVWSDSLFIKHAGYLRHIAVCVTASNKCCNFVKPIKSIQLHAVIVQVCGGKKEKLVSQTPDFNSMDVLKGRLYESVSCYQHLNDDHVSPLSITPGFTLSSEQLETLLPLDDTL